MWRSRVNRLLLVARPRRRCWIRQSFGEVEVDGWRNLYSGHGVRTPAMADAGQMLRPIIDELMGREDGESRATVLVGGRDRGLVHWKLSVHLWHKGRQADSGLMG